MKEGEGGQKAEMAAGKTGSREGSDGSGKEGKGWEKVEMAVV